MRTCKNCKTKFDPQYNKVQNVCSFTCAIELTNERNKIAKKKAWTREKKKRKEALKTRSEYQNELQVIFNKWIRLTKENKELKK
jgi:hypothetical protein